MAVDDADVQEIIEWLGALERISKHLYGIRQSIFAVAAVIVVQFVAGVALGILIATS